MLLTKMSNKIYYPTALFYLHFFRKSWKKVLCSKRTHAIFKFYANAQLTGFCFVGTFPPGTFPLTEFLIKYGRNLFSIYSWNSLNFWATLKKNRRVRPKVYYWTKWVWHWLSQNKITLGKRAPLSKLFAKSKWNCFKLTSSFLSFGSIF